MPLPKVSVPGRAHTVEQNGRGVIPSPSQLKAISNAALTSTWKQNLLSILPQFSRKKMRCDGLEAARNVGEWGVKLGGVPGLAIISFFRLIKVWSCLPVAPRGDPLPSLHGKEFGLLASKPTCLSSRACFWTPGQLCLSWIIHVMKVCQKAWMKEMERTRNSLSEDQRIMVNIYFESLAPQPHQREKGW